MQEVAREEVAVADWRWRTSSLGASALLGLFSEGSAAKRAIRPSTAEPGSRSSREGIACVGSAHSCCDQRVVGPALNFEMLSPEASCTASGW